MTVGSGDSEAVVGGNGAAVGKDKPKCVSYLINT